MKFIDNFISKENKEYRFQLGRTIASALAGFICGALVVFMAWYFISNLPV